MRRESITHVGGSDNDSDTDAQDRSGSGTSSIKMLVLTTMSAIVVSTKRRRPTVRAIPRQMCVGRAERPTWRAAVRVDGW